VGSVCAFLCLWIAVSRRPAQAETPAYDRGMVCFREGRFQEAQPFFEAAARLTPDSPDIWKALGLTLLRLNNYAAAADPLRHACELRSSGDDACYLEGRVLFILARYDEAVAPLDRARRNAAPEDQSRIERALALVWDKLGDAAGAERWFLAAIDHYRSAAQTRDDPRLDYGTFLVRQGRAGEAIKPLAIVLAANPASFAANLETGRALLDLDRPDDALPYVGRAAAIDPASSSAQMLLGKALLRVGRREEGERILSDARRNWEAANQGSSRVR
jgi:Flp pilus assembly protein TadD